MTAYILNVADLFFTYYFLNRGGYELNPVARWMLTVPGLFPFAKIVVAGFLFWLLSYITRIEPAARIALYIITVYYAAIVAYYIILFFGGAIYG